MMLIEIQYPEIVLAQAKLESGNFTSERFKKYNALFGFQTSDTNIIKYKSWKESVIHYKAWQMKRLKSNENYYDFLIRIKYASDSNYINKLKQF
jgi:flagellum-specific peptidoglycan hydrolase FlgJ